MTPEIKNKVSEYKVKFIPDDVRVLEIGSRDINGNVRDLFNGEYIGIDMLDGPNVDEVINAHDLPSIYEEESFDVILCLETIEHDAAFWKTLEVINYLLKREGYVILSAPTYGFPYHGYPYDYYRFSRDAFEKAFFIGMKRLDVSQLKDTKSDPTLIGIWQKR